jgi:hypothetical protein
MQNRDHSAEDGSTAMPGIDRLKLSYRRAMLGA